MDLGERGLRDDNPTLRFGEQPFKIPDDADRLAAIAEKQIEAFALHHDEAKTPRRESAGHRKKRGYKGLIQKTR